MTGLLALTLAALLGIGAASADTSAPGARNDSTTQSLDSEETTTPPPDSDARAYIIDLG